MALNEEILKSQEPLKGLTDDQIKAITTLSMNDENTVIGTRIGEIYGTLDTEIKTVSGMEKNQGEKTYEYNKRVIKALVDQTAKFKADSDRVKTLEAEKADLEKKITDGKGTEVIKQKLSDTEQRLTELQAKYQTDTDTLNKKIQTSENDAKLTKLDTEFERGLSKLAFKAEIQDELKAMMVSNAKAHILSQYTPDWIDDGKGGQRQVFRNKEGQIVNNPDNQLNPFTAAELLQKVLKPALADDSGQGTGTGKPGAGKQVEVTIGNARTQVEADELIIKGLLAKGMVKGTEEFQAKHKEIRESHKVADLPIK